MSTHRNTTIQPPKLPVPAFYSTLLLLPVERRVLVSPLFTTHWYPGFSAGMGKYFDFRLALRWSRWEWLASFVRLESEVNGDNVRPPNMMIGRSWEAMQCCRFDERMQRSIVPGLAGETF